LHRQALALAKADLQLILEAIFEFQSGLVRVGCAFS